MGQGHRGIEGLEKVISVGKTLRFSLNPLGKKVN